MEIIFLQLLENLRLVLQSTELNPKDRALLEECVDLLETRMPDGYDKFSDGEYVALVLRIIRILSEFFDITSFLQ